jgi:hypothetical protein
LARAFVAKAVYDLPTTRALIDMLHASPTLRRLCGWEHPSQIPSEATFSRAMGEFAASELPQRVHRACLTHHRGDKLVGHVARDSTKIEAREKPVVSPKTQTPAVAPKPKRPDRSGGPSEKGTSPPAPRTDTVGATGAAFRARSPGRDSHRL